MLARLGFTTQDISALGLDGEQKDWVHVLVRFRLAAIHGTKNHGYVCVCVCIILC